MTWETDPQSWAIDSDSDGVHDSIWADSNSDGYIDQWYQAGVAAFDTNLDGYADVWRFDTDRDNIPEQSAIDSNRDSRADIWQIDQDADQLVDTMAFDMDGEGNADHWTSEAELVSVGDWSRGWTLPAVTSVSDAVVGGTVVGGTSPGWSYDQSVAEAVVGGTVVGGTSAGGFYDPNVAAGVIGGTVAGGTASGGTAIDNLIRAYGIAQSRGDFMTMVSIQRQIWGMENTGRIWSLDW